MNMVAELPYERKWIILTPLCVCVCVFVYVCVYVCIWLCVLFVSRRVQYGYDANLRLHFKKTSHIHVTLRRVSVTIAAAETQYYVLRVFVFSFRYPAYNAHAPYCHL